MAETLEGLEFQIEAGTDGAIEHLNSLASTFKRLKDATNGLKLGTTANSIKKIFDAVDGDKANALAKFAESMSALRSASDVKISSTIASRISDIATAVRSVRDEDISRLARLGDALSNIGSVGNIRVRISGLSGESQTPGQGIAEDPVGNIGSEARDADMQVRSLRDTLASIGAGVGNALREVVRGIRHIATSSDTASKAVRGLIKYTALLPVTLGANLASKVKESTASLGHLFSAIKRIALYRMIRSVIREVTQGLREGINNIYAWSRALGGEFASAMDSLASSSLYLKNSLGALAAPIIQALVPAINYAIDRIVALMNVINMLVSALGGKATYTAAKRMETSFADAASGAAGAAKNAVDKIKSYTIGIDELNIIDDDKSGGSGGGSGSGGSGGLNTEDMFETLDIDKGISDFANQIKDAFNRHDWKSLGTLLGGKFNEIVDTIEWDKMGTKVGKGLDGIISTAYWTVKTADFKELGAQFATFFNNAIGEVSWDNLGGLLVLGITKPLDAVIGFLLNFDPTLVAIGIQSFITGGFREASAWLDTHEWEEESRKITENICKVIDEINWVEILKSLGEFGAKLQHAFYEILIGALTPEPGSAADKILNILSPARALTKDYGSSYSYNRPSAWSFGSGGISGVGGGVDSPKSIGVVTFHANLADDSKKWNKDLNNWWNKSNNKPVSPFETLVKDTSSAWWQNTNTMWNEKVGSVRSFTTNVKNDSGSWWSNLQAWWGSKVQSPASPFKTNVKDDSKKWWSDAQSYWDKSSVILQMAATIKNEAKTWWQDVQKWWNQSKGNLFLKIVMQVPKIKASAFDAVVSGATNSLFSLQGYETLWGAKGGILDKATLIGAGEAGKEALLPLDQNTGWMDNIAEKVRDTMTSPMDVNYESLERILSRLDDIERILLNVDDSTRRQADKQQTTNVYVGGKPIRDAVIRQQNADGYSFT